MDTFYRVTVSVKTIGDKYAKIVSMTYTREPHKARMLVKKLFDKIVEAHPSHAYTYLSGSEYLAYMYDKDRIYVIESIETCNEFMSEEIEMVNIQTIRKL